MKNDFVACSAYIHAREKNFFSNTPKVCGTRAHAEHFFETSSVPHNVPCPSLINWQYFDYSRILSSKTSHVIKEKLCSASEMVWWDWMIWYGGMILERWEAFINEEKLKVHETSR